MAVREWRRRKPRELVHEHHHTETRAETVPPELLELIEALVKRCAKLEARDLDHEKALQLILQSIDDAGIRLRTVESAYAAIVDVADQMKRTG